MFAMLGQDLTSAKETLRKLWEGGDLGTPPAVFWQAGGRRGVSDEEVSGGAADHY